MSNYFICVGGTGARIGEAFVYLCASGYFGKGQTQIWIVDKDTQCGNGSTLHSAVNEYEAVRANCMWPDAPCFAQELSLNEWNFDDALKALDPYATGDSPFGALARNDQQIQTVMSFLHDAESLDNSMSRGFYGRAQTGTALYKAIEQIPQFFQGDGLFTSIRNDIAKGGTPPSVYLVGSSFGATGASLLPNMAKTLRQQFGNQVAIGAVLMLPYFSYATGNMEGGKPLVSPDTHWEKAREALNYYGDPRRMSIRTIGSEVRGDATLDAFYIVGCDPIASINFSFADGGTGQDNNPHISELYAAMAGKHFFDLARNGDAGAPDAGIPATYAHCVSTGTSFTWQRIDPALVEPMLKLARFSLAALTFVHPLANQNTPLVQDITLQDCFGTSGMFGGKKARIDEDEMKRNVKVVSDFSKRFLDYILFLVYTGPSVELFDWDFLVNLFERLNNLAPQSETARPSRLRELTLKPDYTLSERMNVQSLCQLRRFNANPGVPLPGVGETNSGQLQNAIRQHMARIKKANPSPDQYVQHTREGMKQLYQAVYSFDIGR